MIRLSLQTGTERVPSRRYPDVVYVLRRLRSQEMETARQAALHVLQQARTGLQALEAYGFAGEDANRVRINPLDPDQMAGVGFVVGAVEVMMRALESWEGVLGEDGRPAPIDRLNLAVLLQDDTEANFLLAHVDRIARLVVLEGNGSGPSPDGSTATRPGTKGDRATATGAGKPASPARTASPDAAASSAPRSATRSRARKPPASGG